MIEINRNPSKRVLRQFAGIWLPLFCAVAGGMLWFRFDLPRVAIGVWIAGAVLALAGLVRPAVAKWVYLGMLYATWPIGFVVSHVLLFLVYALVLTPTGLLLRLFGRDPLAKGFDKKAASYWQRREPRPDVTSYFRQS